MMNLGADNQALDSESFRAIADLAYRESGLILSEEKKAMIQSRLRPRLKALNMRDFPSYSSFVGSEAGTAERPQLISALTTNVSHFFRENHHFELLCKAVLERRLESLRNGGQLRIWSAGCSNGQEACSAAISMLEHAPDIGRLDVRVLGTDIDQKVVSFARQGAYPESFLNNVPETIVRKYFTQETVDGTTMFKTKPAISNLIRFNPLNLLADWPMKCKFDVIFCRNVVIYFDPETQMRLWPRFRACLKSDGYLFLGHSERIAAPDLYDFKAAGPTAYQPANQ